MIAERWNHNIAYYGLVVGSVPAGARRALDVGAGDGMLARELSRIVPEVWALERDAAMVEKARAEDRGSTCVRYVRGDLMTTALEPGSFDLVACVAALHHMDAAAALTRMRDLVRPGGRLVVVGLARADLPRDVPYEMAGAVASRVYQASRGFWCSGAPTCPPSATYGEMRALAARLLPGVRYRRHALWRYSLVWQLNP